MISLHAGYASSTEALRLIYCMKAVILCFFSTDDTIRSEHFQYNSTDPRVNFVIGNSEKMLTYIIEHFSQPKSVVLDLTASHTEGTKN